MLCIVKVVMTMSKNIYQCFFLILILVSAIRCYSSSPVTLNVALYPELLDSCEDGFQAFENRIKSDFECRYPHINLILRPMNETTLSWYKTEDLLALTEAYDILETDTVFLDVLIKHNAILPWGTYPCNGTFQATWLKPVDVLCQEIGDYIWPHWVCGEFLFGPENALNAITDYHSFLKALDAVPADQLPLVIAMNEAWTLAQIYVDAFTDQQAFPRLNAINWESINNETIQYLAKLSQYSCLPDGKNPSLSGGFANNLTATFDLFKNGDAAYYIGYSGAGSPAEMLLNNTANLGAIHAPWGDYHHPILAVDSLVLSSRTVNSPEVQAAAQLFANYLTALETYEWMVLGEDCSPVAKPRYVLPASETSYYKTALADNRMMQAYFAAIQKGSIPMPWKLYGRWGEMMGEKILEALQNQTDCTK